MSFCKEPSSAEPPSVRHPSRREQNPERQRTPLPISIRPQSARPGASLAAHRPGEDPPEPPQPQSSASSAKDTPNPPSLPAAPNFSTQRPTARCQCPQEHDVLPVLRTPIPLPITEHRGCCLGVPARATRHPAGESGPRPGPAQIWESQRARPAPRGGKGGARKAGSERPQTCKERKRPGRGDCGESRSREGGL